MTLRLIKGRPVFSLTYVSAAVAPFSPHELHDLLGVCRENNRRREVTGMLLYKDGNFMQVLEGSEQNVRAVHEIISKDRRHRGLITLLEGATFGRHFADWSMGFRDLGSGLDNPEGYNEFLNVPLTGKEFQENPSNAQKLLLSFKKIMPAGGM